MGFIQENKISDHRIYSAQNSKNPQKQWNGYYCFGKKIRWNCKWRKKPEENMERAENVRRARTISSSLFASSPSRRFPFLNQRVQRSGLNCSVNFTKFPKYPYANVQFPSCPLPLKACELFLLFQSALSVTGWFNWAAELFQVPFFPYLFSFLGFTLFLCLCMIQF